MPAPAARPRRVVLIVEDDPDALDAITTVLEEAGYDALRAANGLEALGQLGDHKGRCDLILLDLMMPVMDGRAFLEAQSADPSLSQIAVLVISAATGSGALAGTPGVSGVFSKPLALDGLLDAIVRCL